MRMPLFQAQRRLPVGLAVRREQPASSDFAGPVVHVVGCVTDEVFSFLGPAIQALAGAGREQALIMIDDPRRRHHLNSLARFAALRLVPSSCNPVAQWQAVLQVCRELVAEDPPQAIHLHGLLPCLVGAWTLRKSARSVKIFYSPHASRSIGTLRTLGAIAMVFLRFLLGASRRAAIVNSANESNLFNDWSSSELLESPVSEAFLCVQSREVRRPLIISSGRLPSAQNIELFERLAVLFGGTELGISFNWIGHVDDILRARFQAAGVGVYDPQNDADHALRLAGGWIYIAPCASRGFPICLVQAMAAGLPCVAVDCPQHRGVLRDGDTGYLFATESDMVARVAMLFDSPSLRQLCGRAARAEAKRRFDESEFGVKLLAAYSLPAGVASHEAMSPVVVDIHPTIGSGIIAPPMESEISTLTGDIASRDNP
jgi:glycosyltransferase involved in cell wall biosynthesis